MLIDSNLLIYGAQPGGDKIREFIRNNAPSISVIPSLVHDVGNA